MKKWFSMLLVVTMVVSIFAGCGKKETNKESVNSGSETKSTVESKEETKVEEKKEPTVITFGVTNKPQMDPMPWYETDVWKKVLEEANVIIEFVQYDKDTFNLALVSGDLPDIVYATYGEKVDDIVKSGLALDLSSYIDEYAPNMGLDIYKQRNELIATQKGGKNNALYFIAPKIGVENTLGGTDSSRGYNVRWDYYKELECPEINSDDDYIAVLEQMVKAHPTTESGEKVYAMGVYDNMTQWYQRAAFVKPVLLNMWTVSGSQYMASLEDSNLVNGYTEVEKSAFWTDMKFYNKLYNKGLLDPDSFTQTASEFNIKVSAGRYVATPSRVSGLYNANKKVDPNTVAGLVRVPSENQIVYGNKKLLTGNFPNNYLFVSKKTKNVEAVMQFLNVLHDPDIQRTLASGIEGVHWNYVNGVPTFTDEVKQLIATADKKLKTEMGVNMGLGWEMLMPSFEHPDGYPMSLRETEEVRKETDTPLLKDVASYYGAEYGGQASYNLVKEGKTIDASNDYGQLVAAVMPVRTTDVTRTLEKLNDILYRAIPELVMAKDEAEFAAVQARVLKDLADAGEAKAWEWISTEYNKAKEVVQPIFEASEW